MVPMIAHAVYDFVAVQAMLRMAPVDVQEVGKAMNIFRKQKDSE